MVRLMGMGLRVTAYRMDIHTQHHRSQPRKYRQAPFKASGLALTGQVKEARAARDELLRIDPGASISQLRTIGITAQVGVSPYIDGLRLAGLPERGSSAASHDRCGRCCGLLACAASSLSCPPTKWSGKLFRMSRLGQKRRFDLLTITSGLPRTSDVSGPGRHFAIVPGD
jgi:hypothetical protein